MDDLGELLVLIGIALLVCGDIEKSWPYALAIIIVGAGLYFLDRAISGRR